MTQTQCEQLVSRVLAYVAGTGLPVRRDTTIAALRLVEQALEQDAVEDVYAYVMDRLPQQFSLPQVDLPPLAPPIRRGSIGYSKP